MLRALLEPACERIVIAGSIRRQVPSCHDIEIVAIPKLRTIEPERTLNLWGDDASPLDTSAAGRPRVVSELEVLVSAISESRGGILPRLTNGRGAWGPKYKRAWFLHGGHSYPLDLFVVLPPAQWGAILAIRTGPADLSHKLVTLTHQGGFLPVGYEQRDGALWRVLDVNVTTLDLVETPEEEDYFAALGLACPPPELRHDLRNLKLATEVPS